MTTDDTRKRLLESAGQVFADKGFKASTVREICQRAKANVAAVNYYFRDKERLYVEAVKWVIHCQEENFPLPELAPDTPSVEKLRGFIRLVLGRMLDPRNPPWHHQLFLREMAQPTAACAEVVNERIRPVAEILMKLVGELVPGLPKRKRNLIAFSIVGQCFYHRVARPIVKILVGEEESQAYDAALLAEHVTQFSLAALGLGPPLGGHADASALT
jgi:AcrR family transcriptional regulator